VLISGRLLDREVVPDHRVFEFVDDACGYLAPLVQDSEVVGDPVRERELLLDQQHREAEALVEVAMRSPISRTMLG